MTQTTGVSIHLMIENGKANSNRLEVAVALKVTVGSSSPKIKTTTVVIRVITRSFIDSFVRLLSKPKYSALRMKLSVSIENIIRTILFPTRVVPKN